MTGKPDLRLMARSGVPVAALLLAQRKHANPNAWTVLEYVMAGSLSLVMLGVGLYGASIAMDSFWPTEPVRRAKQPEAIARDVSANDMPDYLAGL